MKVVIAPDSFKENLSALQVANCIEKGFKRVFPRATYVKVPMGDGGEGTVRSLIDATEGKMVSKTVTGPLGDPVKATYGLLGDGSTAIIEMAAASGLPLVPQEKRNPLKTTTFGTGELILDALKREVKTIIVGIGGSATVDAGSGMAQALGVSFVLKKGIKKPKYFSGGAVGNITGIDMTGLDRRLKKTKIIIASDVDNPLIGPKGASKIFGPQKGATPAMVTTLEKNLTHFGAIISEDIGVDIRKYPGAGAAGGLGAGLVAFLNGKMKSGIDIVIEQTELKKALKGADLVITGEGRIDSQTVFGKTPVGVAKVAKKFRIPVVGIGGNLADDAIAVYDHGIDGLESCIARDMDLATAMKSGRRNIAAAAERVAHLLKLGKRM